MLNAILRKDFSEFRNLLSVEKEIKSETVSRDTMLSIAAMRGMDEMVSELLYLDIIDINSKNRYGQTALILASLKGHQNIVQKLLAAPSIDVNIKDSNGYTALMYAESRGHLDISKRLKPLTNINFKDDDVYAALFKAAEGGHDSIVKQALMVPNINVNYKNIYGNSALIIAAEQGHENIVNQLLAISKIDVNIKNNNNQTALIAAVYEGHEKIVRQLLRFPEIDVNAKNNQNLTPLIFAVCHRNVPIVRQLLSFPGIDVNFKSGRGGTPLIMASCLGSFDIFKMLIDTPNVDVNAVDGFGNSALSLALERSNYDMVYHLLKAPDINLDIKTAIVIAATKGNVAIVRLLMRKFKGSSVDINSKVYRLAPIKVLKYLLYSGAYSIANDIFKIDFIKSYYAVSYKEYLTNIKNKVSILSKIKKEMNPCKFKYRLDFLESRICGIKFDDDVITEHTGMSVAKFAWVSSLMRLASLANLSFKFNDYMTMHTLMLRKSIGDFCKLPHVMIANILDFLSGEHFDMSICKMSSTLSLDPMELRSPMHMQSASEEHSVPQNIDNSSKRACKS